MAQLRDASDLLLPAVRAAIEALKPGPEDQAAVQLALQYAKTIDRLPDDSLHDRTWGMRWIGPLLLDALEQLGATPAARARLKGGNAKDAPVSQLAKLRQARRA